MTADILTAAQRESEERDLVMQDEAQFVEGAVWGAARVTPTREQVANELGRHWYDANTEMCDCGWLQFTAKDTSYDNHLAGAVLALMAGLAEGESSAGHNGT